MGADEVHCMSRARLRLTGGRRPAARAVPDRRRRVPAAERLNRRVAQPGVEPYRENHQGPEADLLAEGIESQ